MTTRKRYSDRMATTLKAWSAQITDLQAKARTADGEQQAWIGRQVADLAAAADRVRGTDEEDARHQRGRVQGHAAECRADGGRVPQDLCAGDEPLRALSCCCRAPSRRRRQRADDAARASQVTPTTRPSMTMRTSRRTVTFTRPFSLRGIETEQPAGTYAVETDEELLEGLSFPAYRRVATTIFLPSRPGDLVSGQLVTLDPLELEAAEQRDARSS